MDTITTYVNSKFAQLPQTPENSAARYAMLGQMQDEYQRLLGSGMPEAEAVGRVLASFGDINPYLQAQQLHARHLQQPRTGRPPAGVRPMDYRGEIVRQAEADDLDEVDAAEARAYLDGARSQGRIIGLATFAIIAAVGLLILLSGLLPDLLRDSGLSRDAIDVIPVAILLIVVAFAVMAYIYSGRLLADSPVTRGHFRLTEEAKREVAELKRQQNNSYYRGIILGVGVLILAVPVMLLVTAFLGNDSVWGVPVMMLMIGLGVYILISSGTSFGAFTALEKEPVRRRAEKEAERVTGVVAALIFPLAALVYLYLGFVHGAWHPGWIIFPITGIVFGIFTAVYHAAKGIGD